MNKVFSVASWNVEHFRKERAPRAENARVKRVVDFISGDNDDTRSTPDIFAVYEVEGKDIYLNFMDKFPDHRFHITEGEQTQEIFIGVHYRFQTFSTQRLEFKTGNRFLRPGLLLTIREKNIDYSLLFLHIKSGQGTEDFGLRDAALIHAFNLKRALDKATVRGKANFVFLGDLNTMGIDDPVPYSIKMNKKAVWEVSRLAEWAGKRDMKLLDKDREFTWYNGKDDYKPTNLDHVIASKHLDIRSQSNEPSKVTILGWPKLPQNQWINWIEQYSDHAMLYFELWQ